MQMLMCTWGMPSHGSMRTRLTGADLCCSAVLHWALVDVPPNAHMHLTNTDSEVIPYMRPAPPIGTHRYVFFAYR
jgi:phosphatidylethanolamine-binding protein (PEBP) family uncharacterized protein